MSRKGETALQERLQSFIESKGGYVKKNWGSMISKKGIADLTVCYRGLYLAIEVKDDYNIPSPSQGVNCRNVIKAGGISLIIWSLAELKTALKIIDSYLDSMQQTITFKELINHINNTIKGSGIEDGSKY